MIVMTVRSLTMVSQYDGPAYDLDQLNGLTVGQIVFKIRGDLEFAMPPKGLTRHRARVAGQDWARLVWRCPEVGCFYMCTPRDEKNLAEIIAYHKSDQIDQCP